MRWGQRPGVDQVIEPDTLVSRDSRFPLTNGGDVDAGAGDVGLGVSSTGHCGVLVCRETARASSSLLDSIIAPLPIPIVAPVGRALTGELGFVEVQIHQWYRSHWHVG